MKIFEFDIDGVERGFNFNFKAFSYMEEATGFALDEIIEKLTGKGAKVDLLIKFFHSGARNYAEAKGAQIDFTENDVSDWISDIGLPKAFEMINAAVGAKTPKNSKPHPQKVGK